MPPVKTDIESRLSRVETSVESIIRDMGVLSGNVKDLAGIIRTQGDQVEAKLENLLVGVTNASGPRRTDWQLVLSAVGLVLALGLAAFTPMNMRLNDQKEMLSKLQDEISEHRELASHPVSATRIDAMEKMLVVQLARQQEDVKTLDCKLQTETRLTAERLEAAITALDVRLQREFAATEIKADRALTNTIKAHEVNGRLSEQIRALNERTSPLAK